MVIILISTSVLLWAQKLQHNKKNFKQQNFRCIASISVVLWVCLQHNTFILLCCLKTHNATINKSVVL